MLVCYHYRNLCPYCRNHAEEKERMMSLRLESLAMAGAVAAMAPFALAADD